jgi:putative endonuclease
MLCCSDGSFYTGYTKNLETRIHLHQTGKGARYTKIRKPQKLVYCEEHPTRSLAMRREREIKKLNHQQKQALINSKPKTNSEN